MRQKKGRVGRLGVRVWEFLYPSAVVREGRYVDPTLANSDWSSSGRFHRDLYTVNLDSSDIPIWEEASGNYVRFKINSEGKAELYYNPKKRL